MKATSGFIPPGDDVLSPEQYQGVLTYRETAGLCLICEAKLTEAKRGGRLCPTCFFREWT